MYKRCMICTFSTHDPHLKCLIWESSNTARASKYASMKLKNEINEILPTLWSYFFTAPANYTHICFLHTVLLYASTLVVSFHTVSGLFSKANAQRPSSKRRAQLSLNIKITSLPLQVCSLRLVNYYEHFAMITMRFA